MPGHRTGGHPRVHGHCEEAGAAGSRPLIPVGSVTLERSPGQRGVRGAEVAGGQPGTEGIDPNSRSLPPLPALMVHTPGTSTGSAPGPAPGTLLAKPLAASTFQVLWALEASLRSTQLRVHRPTLVPRGTEPGPPSPLRPQLSGRQPPTPPLPTRCSISAATARSTRQICCRAGPRRPMHKHTDAGAQPFLQREIFLPPLFSASSVLSVLSSSFSPLSVLC